MRTRPPPSTLFPYTTLFRSVHDPQPGLAIVQHEFCLAWRGLRVVAGLGALAAGLERPDDLPIGRKRFRRQVPDRSEEHTSELQSQSNLVCRLLLEKKNFRAC